MQDNGTTLEIDWFGMQDSENRRRGMSQSESTIDKCAVAIFERLYALAGGNVGLDDARELAEMVLETAAASAFVDSARCFS